MMDSTKTAIPGVKVMIITGKDTLTTQTDDDGNFSMSKINADKFSVQVSMLGYHGLKAEYTFAEKEKHKRLEVFTLKMSSQMLKEVVIKGKPNPVRIMQDTVEFNAAAFQVNEGDNVADLMKQFPGMEIDENYNVKTMGKDMVKLRINGKDFFTNNVKDFIGRLPAGIVSKIQVIDDFGDEANFTGIKIGEPIKMLNIVTKPGMNKGVFGNVSSNAGTNDMIGSNGRINLWNDTRQSSADANLSTSNNGAGTSRSLGIGLSHNDKMGKNGQSGFSYSFNNNTNAFSNEQITETINPEGNFTNSSKREGENGGSNHNINWNINYNNKKLFIQGYVMGGYNHSDNQNLSFSNQYGLIRQDLKNSNRSNGSAPNVNASFSISKKLKNQKNSFSAKASFGLSGNSRDQNISTNTIYYDKNTGAFLKDSLLTRDLNSRSNNQNLNFGFNYSIALKKPKDTLGRQSINFSYNGAVSQSMNEVSTFVFDNKTNEVSFVDSLSTSFNTISFNQTLGINYNYGSSKNRYSFGFNARPNMMTNRDLRLTRTIKNNTFNYSPNLNYGRTIAKGKTLSISYQGSNNNPTIQQLQPIRNTQSLQNIIVGNPDLKPSFSHNMNGSFNYSHIKSGRSLQVGINASATQREIVDHVILVPDTLNSLKQITRYENVDGNYQISGNYNFHVPIKSNKYSVSYSGSMGFSNRAVIFNNNKVFGKGINFSQRLAGSMTTKKITLNTQAGYTITNNNNASSLYRFSEYQPIGIGQISAPAFFKTITLNTSVNGSLRLKNLTLNTGINYNTSHSDPTGDQAIRDISNINMNLSGRLTIFKSYFINLNTSKRLNYGYALANSNPFIINTTLGKNFLKDKNLSLTVSGNDLLGQGNNISRMVSGNTIIDSRNKQQTRIFSLNLNYNLSRFGGRHFRVNNEF
ncbi:outer membrane beta-barrel protein [Pedobacter frigoris]|uniref:outer membrane beta-barrel protein n=1 Tax=Pedobacter frigoris TaxID=2571272 RepID=UPI0021D05BAB|nr:outer membrane beta-barrel protein [Pedobacter frigoris]